jgi:hypothetical protein
VRGLPNNGKLNDTLELAEQQLLDCYRTHRQLPSTEVLRAAVVPVAAEKTAATATVNFWEHLDEWVNKKRVAGLLSTARTYATAARRLREFAQASRYGVG